MPIFVIITGGASSLLEYPVENISEADLIKTYKALVISGYPIQQINIIRKHLSSIKGGKLVLKTKAQIIGILISDVPGDDLATIGSGPTVEDKSTFEDCLKLLKQNNIISLIPSSIVSFLEKGTKNESYETVKKFPNVKQVKNFLLSSNHTFLKQMQDTLSKVCYTDICTTKFDGEAKDIATFLSQYVS